MYPNLKFAKPIFRKGMQQTIRIMSKIERKEHGKALQQLKLYKQLKFAWDNPKEDIRENIEELLKYIKAWKLMCYVLIGFNSTIEEDLYRIETLRSYNIDPYVMPYDKTKTYQQGLARYVNRKATFNSCTWTEYCETKGIEV